MMKAHIFNIQKFSLNDGPGIRTVVFFKGCPLRCRWCSNPESQELSSDTSLLSTRFEAGEMTVDEVYAVCMQDYDFYAESGGGVTGSGGEVTMQAPFAAELFSRLHASGVSTTVETSAFCSEEAIRRLIPCTDHFLMDVKHWDEHRHLQGTGVSNSVILRNIRMVVDAGCDVLPRIPVIPGFNDGCENADGFSAVLSELGLRRVQLLPFHQFGESKYEKLGKEYFYRNMPALHEENLTEMLREFEKNGIEAFL